MLTPSLVKVIAEKFNIFETKKFVLAGGKVVLGNQFEISEIPHQ